VAIATVVAIVVASVMIATVIVPSVRQRMLPMAQALKATTAMAIAITAMAIVTKAIQMARSLSVKQTQLQ
jgi:hypothetical protein